MDRQYTETDIEVISDHMVRIADYWLSMTSDGTTWDENLRRLESNLGRNLEPFERDTYRKFLSLEFARRSLTLLVFEHAEGPLRIGECAEKLHGNVTAWDRTHVLPNIRQNVVNAVVRLDERGFGLVESTLNERGDLIAISATDELYALFDGVLAADYVSNVSRLQTFLRHPKSAAPSGSALRRSEQLRRIAGHMHEIPEFWRSAYRTSLHPMMRERLEESERFVPEMHKHRNSFQHETMRHLLIFLAALRVRGMEEKFGWFAKTLADDSESEKSIKAMRGKLRHHLPRLGEDGFGLVLINWGGANRIVSLEASDRLNQLFLEDVVPGYVDWIGTLNIEDLAFFHSTCRGD